LLGVIGGILRSRQVAFAFEAGTDLLIKGNFETVGLHIICIVSVLLFLAAAMYMRLTSGKYNDESAGFIFTEKLLYIVSAFVLLFGVAYELIKGGAPAASRIIFMALSIFAAASVLIAAKHNRVNTSKDYAFFRLVPVFWNCFWLILFYRDRSSNPNVETYSYELLALAMSALMFYYSAGDGFGAPKPSIGLFFCMGTVFFSTTAVVGQIAGSVIYMSQSFHIDSAVYLLACAAFAFAAGLGLYVPGPVTQENGMTEDPPEPEDE
jgi:hypothetical protein